MLRHKQDRTTLFVSFSLFPLLPCLGIAKPNLLPFLLPLFVYSSYLSGVLSHYHVHNPIFTRRRWNDAYSWWLSAFYGFPVQAWIPTHNQNHHMYVNGPGDATRSSEPDTLITVFLYPLRSSAAQLPLLRAHVRALRERNRRVWRQWNCQIAAVATLQLGLAVWAIAAHGVRDGLLTYAAVGLGPMLFAPWAMMVTNYVQHVGCDPSSVDNHSRNFVGKIQNRLVFNAGYHSVHHEHPHMHWSGYADLHAQRALTMSPDLQEQSVLGFFWKRYFASPDRFINTSLRRFRSAVLRRET